MHCVEVGMASSETHLVAPGVSHGQLQGRYGSCQGSRSILIFPIQTLQETNVGEVQAGVC
jgi:hypothetical protein